MSSSEKNFDTASLASDAPLLSKKDQDTGSKAASKKQSLLSRLSGSRSGTDSSSKTASSSKQADGKQADGKQATRAIDDVYRKFLKVTAFSR
ncbi:cfa72d3e-5115-41e8-9fe2-36cb181871b7 [Thermothielavioides terrestris]|uniref:Cfa72d3e-5115-41e8-9fe2-36cb181871b7 n=1 Tax=Thermothielavioides terrestris TaxID=2587410 RepID=A0A446BDP8_9PEZI|nr:cfa72d3e-5115-41e8-9fe2-36cb181871b7 [Thermothielavioides terrestris]